jgi:phosphatidate phosphatase LPIN
MLSLIICVQSYITRRDGSPLMDALSMWRDAALQDGGSEMSSPRDSLSRAPSPTLSDEEDARTEKDASEEEPQTSEVRRSGTEPAPQPTRKPTSSSWVRWWSRSRGNRENKDTGDASVKGDRPPLRSFATDSRSPGVGAVEREVSRAEAELAAPAGAIPASGSMPRGIEGAPGVVALPQTAIEKKYAKTLRLTSDQLVRFCASTLSVLLKGVSSCRNRLILDMVQTASRSRSLLLAQ